MSKKLLVGLGAAVVIALLAGVYYVMVMQKPGGPPPIGAKGPCSAGNPHCLVVTVSSDGSGGVKIDDVPQHEVKGNPAWIYWELGTPGYVFPTNGIVFPPGKPGGAAPQGEFDPCEPHPSSNTVFRCKDNHNTTGLMGYTITLESSSSGPAPPPKDPFILNN